MGIYRTLLEEEVPHLDDNNNPDEQIKELQDVIDDHDANEAEQVAAQDAAFGPDCGVDDIMDESAMAIYEFECGHAAIMQAIGVHELQEATAGRDFIMEAADVKGFFKSVKDKVVAFFKKVWSVLQRWAGNLAAMVTSNKKFVTKYADAMKKGHAIVKGGKADVKKVKGYTYDGLDSAIGLAKANKTADAVSALFSKSPSEDTAEAFEEMVNKFRGTLCGTSSVSAGEFASTLKEKLYGDKSTKEIDWMDPQTVIDILNDKKDSKKAVNDFMAEAKKQMRKSLDELNRAEKQAKSDNKDDAKALNSSLATISRQTTALRAELTATQIWRGQVLGAIRSRGAQARKFGMIYVRANNKDTHRGFQKESTEYGFLGNLGLV